MVTLIVIITVAVVVAICQSAGDATTPVSVGVTITKGNVGTTRKGIPHYYAVKAQEAGVAWVRYDGPRWSEIEPTAPTRNPNGSWSHTYNLSAFERSDTELRLLVQYGLTPIVILQSTPAWAVDPQARTKAGRDESFDTQCLPINSDPEIAGLEHFAAYAKLVVERYKGRFRGTAYNVNHWEIWNEPDAAMQAVPSSAGAVGWGCWGDRDDQLYGGEAFGRMLSVVYPAIKAEDADATVLHGGLLLGSDTDPGGTGDTISLRTGAFLDGVLHAVYPDGQYDAVHDEQYFDGVAFHSYAYWRNPADTEDHTLDWNLYLYQEGAWLPNPESLPQKAQSIRDSLESYNVDKPVLVNEGAFLCVEGALCRQLPLYDAFLDDQANYLLRYYVRAWAHGLTSPVWYPLNRHNWRQAHLFNRDHDALPAYQTLRLLGEKLAGATYIEQVSSGVLEGHRFVRGRYDYFIYWTNDSAISRPVELPKGAVSVYNIFGASTQEADEPTIMIGFDPIIIEHDRGRLRLR